MHSGEVRRVLGPLALAALLVGPQTGVSPLLACSGPPPLHLELQFEMRPAHPDSALLSTGDDQDPEASLPGEPVAGLPDRLVRLNHNTRQGEAFSVSPLGPTPSMLLQWGQFDGDHPWEATRRRGYRVQVHEPAGLPAPPEWIGPWKPGSERWFATPAILEDSEAVRFLHRNMGSRIGDEVEPWLKLEHREGRPARLHLWLVLGGEFEEAAKLQLRLEPRRPGRVRILLEGESEPISPVAVPEAGARFSDFLRFPVPTSPASQTIHARLELAWGYGSWAEGDHPWVWSPEIEYLGYFDLARDLPDLTASEITRLTTRVEAVRSRLRCLPGDQDAPSFPGAEPCSFVASSQPDAFLDPGSDALVALLEAILPSSRLDEADRLVLEGEPTPLDLRYHFSGLFPHACAPFGSPEAVQAALGRPAQGVAPSR